MTITLPSHHNAVVIRDHTLAYQSMPLPAYGSEEVLIKVHAAGVNRADLFQVQGTYPFPCEADGILGLEIAGEVVACGNQVSAWRIGDKVCGIVQAGGYGHYAAAHAAHLLPIPTDMPMEDAACLPEALATVWLALFIHAHISPHETALIHGGSSGIGVMAIQMLRRYGVRIFTTAGSHAKCAACTELGAHRAINYHQEDFVSIIKEATAGKGVDVVLDMVGGDYVERNLKCLGLNGRLISIAFLQGVQITANMAGLLMKDALWRGTRLRSQTIQTKADIMQALREKVWPDVAAGHIRPVLHQVFSLQEAEKAHQTMHEGLHIGKIVLKMCHFPNT